jgi:hypothetical protein
VEETGLPGENHRSAASHWQSLHDVKEKTILVKFGTEYKLFWL